MHGVCLACRPPEASLAWIDTRLTRWRLVSAAGIDMHPLRWLPTSAAVAVVVLVNGFCARGISVAMRMAKRGEGGREGWQGTGAKVASKHKIRGYREGRSS